jgi:hypothetical protein
VRLTVSEIRQKIFEASRLPSDGAGSIAGRLFHRTAECALRPGHPACWQSVLTANLDSSRWARALYEHSLGPDLTRSQSSLFENGQEVLAVWRGVQSFTTWFCGLLAEAMSAGAIQYDETREEWTGVADLFQPESSLMATISDPSWTGDVQISGRADQLICVGDRRWCVVEFKLGGGHAESDAAQACLYHELLGGAGGAAALVRFGTEPAPSETLLSGEWISEARPRLLALIAALAGVLPPFAPQPTATTAWPHPAAEAEQELGRRLVRVLREFNAEANIIGEPLVGPTFVRFVLEPARGISVRNIERQGRDIQVRLQLEQEPMIGQAGGRVVVDVQRPKREFVPFATLVPSLEENRAAGANSSVLVGVDLMGAVHFVDLGHDVPHLLVGGIPGSGKSEWLRSALASLLLANTPETLRLVLIDPKKNAFADLAESEFLWREDSLLDSPDGRIAVLLEQILDEMKARYDLFKREYADDLAHYTRKVVPAPPRLLCVVDEFADLVMSGPRKQREEIERGFARIAQMGRAAGIHLILATQRPSRQVVSGLLKASIPGRIALRVNNHIDSSVLLDRNGAQHLLGKGDLLLSAGSYDLLRLQSAYLGEDERKRIFRPQPSK